jgi:histidine ammonia-lyase
MNLSVKAARSISSVTLTDCKPTLEEFTAVAKFGAKLEFSDQMKETVRANRKLLDKFLEEGRIIYGVTTGFGENVRYTISPEDATTLQENIVRTHSVAVGEPLTGSRPGRSCS